MHFLSKVNATPREKNLQKHLQKCNVIPQLTTISENFSFSSKAISRTIKKLRNELFSELYRNVSGTKGLSLLQLKFSKS